MITARDNHEMNGGFMGASDKVDEETSGFALHSGLVELLYTTNQRLFQF